MAEARGEGDDFLPGRCRAEVPGVLRLAEDRGAKMRDPGMSAVGSEPENLRKVQRDHRDHRVGMQTARSTKLEELRRLAARYGVPVEVADRLTLRPREVARATGFGLRTVERWIATGRLPAIRLDEGVAVALHDLLRFFEENRAVPTRRMPTSLKNRAQPLIEKGSRG